MIRTNRKMAEAIERAGRVGETATTGRIWSIVELLWPDFVESNGCILLERADRQEKLDMDWVRRHYKDRTGLEASLSDTRVDSYMEAFEGGPIEGLALGLRAVETWGCKLKTMYPEYVFHIILAFDGEHTTLRFHRFREQEGSWLDPDLERYEREAVLVKEYSSHRGKQ